MQQQNSGKDPKQPLSWSAPASSAKVSALQTLSTAKQGAGNAGRYVGIFVAGLIVGVLVSWSYGALKGTTPVAGTPNAAKPAVATQNSGTIAAGVQIGEDGMAHSNQALRVSSPQKAGLSVAVASATVSAPTWVVVYESKNGKPGNVLGAHLFFTSGAGVVTLLRSTVAGQTYLVGTSPDSGDRKYSKSVDKASLFSDGTLQVTSFTAN